MLLFRLAKGQELRPRCPYLRVTGNRIHPTEISRYSEWPWYWPWEEALKEKYLEKQDIGWYTHCIQTGDGMWRRRPWTSSSSSHQARSEWKSQDTRRHICSIKKSFLQTRVVSKRIILSWWSLHLLLLTSSLYVLLLKALKNLGGICTARGVTTSPNLRF